MEDKVAEAQARTEKSLLEHQQATAKVEKDFKDKEMRLQKNLRDTLEKMM